MPAGNGTKLVEAIQIWEVKWVSVTNHYPHTYNTQSNNVEWFADEIVAENFAESLRNAFRLVRSIGAKQVTVTKLS